MGPRDVETNPPVGGHGPAEPDSTRTDRLRILQEHLLSLRRETEGWIDRQARVWQTAIAGVAAVYVLREDTTIEALLPLAPILAAAIMAQWLSLLLMVLRAGRAMTLDEHRINDLLGEPPLLSHEIRLWEDRSKRLDTFHRLMPLVVVGTTAVGVGYAFAVWRLVSDPQLSLLGEVKAVYWGAGTVAFALVITNLVRLSRLPRRDPRE